MYGDLGALTVSFCLRAPVYSVVHDLHMGTLRQEQGDRGKSINTFCHMSIHTVTSP